jgi:hypothetical protein
MSEQHTPGPWTVGCNGDDCAKDHAICAESMVIGKVYGRGYPSGSGWSPDSAADARLIAEAPVMLALLRDALECLARLPNVDGAYRVSNMQQIRQSIARIEGGL